MNSQHEVYTLVNVSTQHIMESDADLLYKHVTGSNTPLIVYELQETGFLVSTFQDGEVFSGERIIDSGYSVDFLRLFQHFRDAGHHYILFDRDGGLHESFDSYDW